MVVYNDDKAVAGEELDDPDEAFEDARTIGHAQVARAGIRGQDEGVRHGNEGATPQRLEWQRQVQLVHVKTWSTQRCYGNQLSERCS